MDHPQYPYGILLIANSKLTAEAKFVLFQIHRLFEDRVVNEQVKLLAHQMGVSDKAITSARDLLLELDYLISVPRIFKNDGEQKAGRPNIAFQISRKTLTELDQINTVRQKHGEADLIHKQRIDALLCQFTASRVKQFIENKDRPIPKRLSGVLTSANRILLAILYCHADACGVVRGLGLSKLERLVGMTAVRLDSQLNKLANMGYVLAREPGVSGRFLFGRSTGALFLNVFDDALGDRSNLATLILMQTNDLDDYNKYNWGQRIFRESTNTEQLVFRHDPNAPTGAYYHRIQIMRACHSEIKENFARHKVLEQSCAQDNNIPTILTYPIGVDAFTWTRDFDPFKLQNLFKDAPLPIFARYLQLKINEYASMLLTQHWDDLNFKAIHVDDNLVEKITAEIYPDLKRENSDDGFFTPQIAEALGIFIYRIAFETAIQAKCIVNSAFVDQYANLPLLNNASYAILPVSGHSALMFTVAVKLADQSLQERYIQVHTDKLQHTLTRKSYTADMSTSTDLDVLLKRFGYHTKIKV